MEIYSFCLLNSFDLAEYLLVGFFKGYCVEYVIRIVLGAPLLGLARALYHLCGSDDSSFIIMHHFS